MRERSGYSLGRAVATLLRPVMRYQRERLFEAYLRSFPMRESLICLDVGGVSEGFEELRKVHKCLSVNLVVRKRIEGWQLVIGDGTMLPFRDKSVDICISNSVIEHVREEDAEKIADEIRRVARKGYFVSVPYLFTPLEPHYFLPLFQFVPESLKRFLLYKVGLTIGWMSRRNYHPIRLLKGIDVRRLFPDAHVKLFLLFGVLPTNVLAIHLETRP